MKLGKYISELLYHHDFVILPGFGTFSTRYVPAKFIPEKKIVESPTKVADFAPEPKDGDTPLPAYIAEKEGKPVEKVNDFISDVVKEIRQSLQRGKRVELEQLGIFHLDTDGSFHFEPDRSINFLDEATDIPEVKTPLTTTSEEPEKHSGASAAAIGGKMGSAPAVDENQKKTAKPVAESENIHPKLHEKMKEKKTKLPPALKWLAYIIIPLLVILIILFLSFTYFFGETGLFRRFERPVTEIPAEVPEQPEIIEEPAVPEEEELVEPEPVTPDPALEPPRPDPDRTVYYVVVGSFRNGMKAQQLAEKLRKEGADLAHVFMETPSKYHRVCYGYYYDLAEAKTQKARLRDDLRDIAWILHR